MKRRLNGSLLLLAVIATSFGVGFKLACNRLHWYETQKYQELKEDVQQIGQTLYGRNDFHHREGLSPEKDAKLTAFDPAKSTGSITLTHINALAQKGTVLRLTGDGRLEVEKKGGEKQTVTKLDPECCKAFFHKVLTSGILNYSSEVVEIKKEVFTEKGYYRDMLDGVDVEIQVAVPELEVKQTVAIQNPEFEQEVFPGIIEFQIFNSIEKEMLDLVPKDYPLWK